MTALFQVLVWVCVRSILARGGFEEMGRSESQPAKARATTLALRRRDRRRERKFIEVSARENNARMAADNARLPP